jgi:hypothetical protein
VGNDIIYIRILSVIVASCVFVELEVHSGDRDAYFVTRCFLFYFVIVFCFTPLHFFILFYFILFYFFIFFYFILFSFYFIFFYFILFSPPPTHTHLLLFFHHSTLIFLYPRFYAHFRISHFRSFSSLGSDAVTSWNRDPGSSPPGVLRLLPYGYVHNYRTCYHTLSDNILYSIFISLSLMLIIYICRRIMICREIIMIF